MKKELIEKIMSLTHPTQDIAYVGKGFLQQILEEELPDFSRIDEERFKRIYASKVCDIGLHIKEYNSTLPPALVPLPKEMPKDLTRFAMGHDVYEVWDKIISEYGTPAPKLELPSVEELAKEIKEIPLIPGSSFTSIAQHIHSKYSLPTREWWQDLNEGDKFMYAGQVYEYYGYEVNHRCEVTLWGKSTWKFRLSGCTPYTTPTADDIIAKHNLSEEEVKILREGKC